MGWLLYPLPTMLRYIQHWLQKFKGNLHLASISKIYLMIKILAGRNLYACYLYYLSVIFKCKIFNNILVFNKKLLLLGKRSSQRSFFAYFINVSTLNVYGQISLIFSRCTIECNFWDSWFHKKWLHILVIFKFYVYKVAKSNS